VRGRVDAVSERERRIGANEAIFREVNERIEEINRTFAMLTETMEIMCECGSLRCAEMISISLSEYERIRSDPTLFAIVTGHDAPDVESVVEQQDGFDVVRKHPGEPQAVAEATDPRA
jgi:hypothetical protein